GSLGTCLGTLGAVLGTRATTIIDPGGVEGAAQDVIAHARQVLDSATTDQDDRVLLKVVTLARDVGDHLDAVDETNLGDLAERRVRLLGRRGVDAGADTALLRVPLEVRRLALVAGLGPTVAEQLVDRRHRIRFASSKYAQTGRARFRDRPQ